MQRVPYVGLLLMSAFVVMWGCDGGYKAQKSKSEEASMSEESSKSMESKSESMESKSESMESKSESMESKSESMESKSGALMASAGAGGAEANNEGVGHYEQGHWDVAQEHFKKAVAANAELAEAHYNLALALDKMGEHGEATKHFQMALDHGSDNPDIKDSGILKAHLGM